MLIKKIYNFVNLNIIIFYSIIILAISHYSFAANKEYDDFKDYKAYVEKTTIPLKYKYSYETDLLQLINFASILINEGRNKNSILLHGNEVLNFIFDTKLTLKDKYKKQQYDAYSELNIDTDKLINTKIIKGIDGIIIKNQYCNNYKYKYLISPILLKKLIKQVKVFSQEICNQYNDVYNNQNYATDNVVVYVVMRNNNKTIYSRPPSENSSSISNVIAAENFVIEDKGYMPKLNNKQLYERHINSNYDLVIIDNKYKTKQLGQKYIKRLKRKKMGAKRLVLAKINLGYISPASSFWKDEWLTNKVDWLKKYNNKYIVKFWTKEWKEIISQQISQIVGLGYDGIVLTGLDVYEKWMKIDIEVIKQKTLTK